MLVGYPERGHRDKIMSLAAATLASCLEVGHDQVNDGSFCLPVGDVLVDITGLAKPVIFEVVSRALARDRTVVVAYTGAEVYFPLDEEVETVLSPGFPGDMFSLLDNARQIWTGEQGPYQFVRLLISGVDQSRRRILCAAVSPQHERLLSLVEERDYDRLCIIEPEDESPRARLARLAADVATQGRFGSRRDSIASDDLAGMVNLIGRQFDEFYIRDWFDVEFGLTGSKMHAVACAAVSVVLKVAQCWYVEPAMFDPRRFTRGAKETRLFRISLPEMHSGDS